MPIDPAQLQTLQEHDRNKKISDIPKFLGLPGKDRHTAKQTIQMIDLAAEHCAWTEETKAIQLCAALQGPAQAWFEGLNKSHDVDSKDYATLKQFFLEHYEGLVTNTALTLSLKELQQKKTEKVSSFNDRVQVVFNHYYDQHVALAADPDNFVDALNTAGANRAVFKKATERAAKRMMIRMQMSLYEAGLLEPIRLEVARKTYDNLRDMQKEAQAAEARLISDRKLQIPLDLSPLGLEANEDDEAEEHEAIAELDGEAYDTVAAVYRSRGKPIPAFFKRRYQNYQRRHPVQNPNQGAASKPKEKKELDCWYCGKKGHISSQCYSKKAGRPRNPNAGPSKISEVTQGQENIPQVSAIGCPSVNATICSLNY